MRWILLLFIGLQTSAMAQTKMNWSDVKMTAIRLSPHQDLKQELVTFAKKHQLKAAFITTGVGSLEQIHIRYANEEHGTLLKGHFEIVSLVGTFSDTSSHIHISVSDSTGKTIGGHLLDNNLIYTTAEVVIGELINLEFNRSTDSTYGYKELDLKIRKKN
ncbi:MAG: DNA-binding protein [Cyclobacteriaceae bacterium]|nr:DNA-binding protein [Cyclobacteriaceae bacterium]